MQHNGCFYRFLLLAFISHRWGFPFHEDVKCIRTPGTPLAEGAQIAVPHRTFAPQSWSPSPLLALRTPGRWRSRGIWGHFSSRRKAIFERGDEASLNLGWFSCYKALWTGSWTRARPASAITGLVTHVDWPGTGVLMAALKALLITRHTQHVWFATFVAITKTANILPASQLAISDKA